MPTTRGWAAVGVAAALASLWLAFGEIELAATAAFLAIALLVGLGFVRTAAPRVDLIRHLQPGRIHEGDEVAVEVAVRALRTIRNVALEDTVHGLGVARFAIGRSASGARLIARYEIMCRNRGIFDVGPAEISVSDAFAFAERRVRTGPIGRLIVYPAVEPLSGFPAVRGHDPDLHRARPTFSPQGGEEFFTLREYHTGDDLRRVHWPSSAKRDELMIKQLDVPWQARGVVLLDRRQTPYATSDAFEQAVRGAASVVTHLYGAGFSPELWTGERLPVLRSAQLHTQALEVLATVWPLRDLELHQTAMRLRRQGLGGGALVIVTGTPDEDVLATYRVLARDFARIVVMAVADPPPLELEVLQRAGAVTVCIGPNGRWAPAWRTAMELSWSTASAG